MSAAADRRVALRSLARVALVPPAALAVHQLRYLLAFGGKAGTELTQQGHSYLHSVVPWIMLVIGLGIGAFLWALGRAMAGRLSAPRYTFSLAALWLVCSLCLVAIYVTQESLEGLFATGHPGGIAGIFGSGGWWSIPAALCVGLVLAAVFHGASWVLREVARRCAVEHRRPRRLAATRQPVPATLALRPSPLAGCAAGRAPPGRLGI
jgi:hypothetical protein